jgi:hypothetical protein
VSMRFVISVLVGLSVAEAPPAFAEDNKAPKALVQKIVDEYRSRQTAIRTITCSARVETFFPKGYLSEKATIEFDRPRGGDPVPANDQRFADEPCSWAIDFVTPRVRKESRLTIPRMNGRDPPEPISDPTVHLFTNGKYTLFRSKDRPRPVRAKKWALSPDVFLYEGRSHEFLFSFVDLPLIWTAGGLTGKYPLPTRMHELESPDRFSGGQVTEWKGHKCALLTVQEQNSTRKIREFWVGLEPSYPIYYCRARDADSVSWQLEVDYRAQDGRLIPTAWGYTEYTRPPAQLFRRSTYVVQNIALNTPLSQSIFEKQLEPGMLVLSVPENKDLEVDQSGALVPMGSAYRRLPFTRTWMWTGAGAAVLVSVFVIVRYLLRRPTEC